MPASSSSRPAVVLLLLLVGLGTLFVWWGRRAIGRPADGALPVAVGEAVPGAGPGAVTEPRTVVAPPVPPPVPVPAGVSLLVRGRMLAAESSAPLAGVQVALRVADAEHDCGTAVSGDDGTFALVVELPAALDVRLSAALPPRAPVEATREGAAGTWDLGDVLLSRTAMVRGEVVDRTGQPVEGVEVMLLKVFLPEPPMQFRNMRFAVTDARGAFAFDGPVAAGEWSVGVDRTGALVGPRHVQVPDGGEHTVRIEVERPDPAQDITGRVVDPTGLPLAGVELAAFGEGSRGRGISGADGVFTLHRGPPHWNDGKTGVELSSNSKRRQLVGPDGSERLKVAWGQRDVRATMRSLGSVVVQAVDARGRAVAAVDVLLWQVNDRQILLDYPASSSARLADGPVRVDGLRRGEHVVQVRPRDAAFAVGGPQHFQVGDEAAPQELRVTVPDPVAVEVAVVDGGGRPVRGCALTFLTGLTAKEIEPALACKPIAHLRPAGARGGWQLALATATTDDDGLARASLPPGRCRLSVRSHDHLPVCPEVTIVAGGPPLCVVLQAATVLHGRLVSPAAVATLAADATAEHPLAVVARPLVVEPQHSRAASASTELARAEVAADGTFALGPLPPGGVHLELQWWLACNRVHATTIRSSLGDLDTVDDPLGRAVEREFAVDPLRPASLTGEVLLDGRAFADQQVFFMRHAPDTVAVRVPTDADGRFATRAPPGDYDVRIAIPAQPGPGHVILPLPATYTFGAGAAVPVRVDARTRRLTLRVLGADGAPLAGRRVRFDYDSGYNRPGALATDAAGDVVIEPAPYGAFVLFVAADNGAEARVGPLQLPPGDGPAELEFRVGG